MGGVHFLIASKHYYTVLDGRVGHGMLERMIRVGRLIRVGRIITVCLTRYRRPP